jgi:outer membrane lipoprotein-sorting protein
MKRLRKACLVLAFLLAVPLQATAQDEAKTEATKDALPTIDEITKRLDDLYRSDSSHAMMTMKVVKERGTRELSLESWSKGEDLSLIVIRKPAREAGTATLKTDEGLWNYAPRADRLIRIPAGLLSDAWMGSHFTNDDLVRESSYQDDYKTKLSWAEVDGSKALKVLFIPRPDAPVIYTKIEYFLRPGDYVPIRADYYDEGKLMRRMQFSDVREVNGKNVPHKMELIPMDKKNERTVITYQSLEFNVKLDKDLFTKRGLRRAAKRR